MDSESSELENVQQKTPVRSEESEFCIIVVGMHRSGTSAITGILQQVGVFLGDVNNAAEDNVKGNKEPRVLIDFHDDILQRNGGSWSNPTKPLKWSPIHYHLRDLYLKQFEGKPVYGFKDPRTLLVLGDWLSVKPNAKVIGIFRHPYLVAKSLLARNNMPISEGLSLWTHYNRELLWHAERKENIRLIEFAVDGDQFENQLRALLKELALADTAYDFFNHQLRSEVLPDYSSDSHSRAALALYEKLCDLTTTAQP